MSSISTTPRSTSAADAAGKPRKSRAEQIRTALLAHLKRTAAFIKTLETLTHTARAIALFLLVWVTAVVLDHWLVPLPAAARWGFFLILVGGIGWLLLFRVIPLLVYRINLIYAATRVEQLVPEFKNGLVTWLELEMTPDHGTPPGIVAALAYRARKFIGGHDPSSIVDTSPLIRAVALVLLLSCGLIVYAAVVPKSVYTTLRRVMVPWASIEVPTRVKVLKVEPGDTEVTFGAPLEIHAELKGLRPDEPVIIRFSTDDNQLVDQRIDMTPVTAGFHYVGELKTGPEGVEHQLHYRIEAGDAISRSYRVTISPRPRVMLESIQLVYPEYTGLAPKQFSRDVLEAVEGTTAVIRARANQPLKKARIEINPRVDERTGRRSAETVRELAINGLELHGQLLMQLNENRDNPTPIRFQLRGFNERGDTNVDPIEYQLSAIADAAPEVTLQGPLSRIVQAAVGQRVPLEVIALDPDYGLAKMSIQIQRADGRKTERIIFKDAAFKGRQLRTVTLDLRELDARAGEKLLITAQVWDNRHDPVTRQWSPNTATSEQLMIVVRDPGEVPPAQSGDEARPGEEQQRPPQAMTPDQQPQPTAANDETTPQETPENAAGQPPQQPDGPPQAGDQAAPSDGAGGEAGTSASASQTTQQPDNNSLPQSGDASTRNDSASGDNQSSITNRSAKSTTGESAQQQSSTGRGSSGADAQDGGNQSTGTTPPAEDASHSDRTDRSTQQTAGSNSRQNAPGDAPTPQDAEVIKRVAQFLQRQQQQSGTRQADSPDQSSGTGPTQEASQQQAPDAPQPGGQQTPDGQATSAGQQSNKPSDTPQGAQSGRREDVGEGTNPDQPNPDQTNRDGQARPDGQPEAGDSSTAAGARPDDGGQQAARQNNRPDQTSGAPDQGDSANAMREPGNQAPPAAEPNNDQANRSGNSQPSNAQDTTPQSDGNQNQPTGDNQSSQPSDRSGSTPQNQTGGNQPQANQSDSAQSDDGQSSQANNGEKNTPSQSSGSQDSGQQPQDGQSAANQNGQGQNASGQQNDGNQQGNGEPANSGQSGQEQSGSSSGQSSQGASGQEQSGSQSGANRSNQGQSGSGETGQTDQSGQSGTSASQDGQAGQSGSDQEGQSQSASGQSNQGQAGHQQSEQQRADGASGQADQSASGRSSSRQQTPSNSPSNQCPAGVKDCPGGNCGHQVGQQSGGVPGGRAPAQSAQRGNGQGTDPHGGSGGNTGQGPSPVVEQYTEEVTQMVLDYLTRQKDQPDPELLRELNWTEEDLQEFVQRWQSARQLAASPDPADRLRWKQMLEELGLEASGQRDVLRGPDINDAFQRMLDAGSRIEPPRRLRERLDAFRRALERQRAGTGP